MGILAETFRRVAPVINASPPALPAPGFADGIAQPGAAYLSYARNGYAGNEIVFSAIELLASSAAEPRIVGTRKRRARATIRDYESRMTANAIPAALRRPRLISNGYIEDLPNHPAVTLLNNPNPFMSRGQLWGTVVMDRALAGNAYLVKVRSRVGNVPMELWRLRPDRVKVIPSKTDYIEGYEYRPGGGQATFIPREDVIHFRTRNPFNDYYGMPPMMAISGRVDIDNYMRSFLRGFFERGGTGPGSILSIKQKVTQQDKDAIRDRFRNQFGGPGGYHEMMILDQAESTYTPMGLNRGLRDALPKDINAMQESRIAIAFGIPGSILGLLIGYESSSYANKKADWQVFWDITMAPLLSDLDDVLNLSLVPDYAGIDQVAFDLSDIKALQEDVDKLQDRERKNFVAGAISLEEFRDAIGRDPNAKGGLFYVPSNLEVQEYDALGEEPPAPQVEAPTPADPMPMMDVIEAPRCPTCRRQLAMCQVQDLLHGILTR